MSEKEEDAVVQAPAAPRGGWSRRTKALVAVLALTLAGWAGTVYSEHQLRLEAQPLVEKLLAEYREPGFELASELTVGRNGLFLGAPFAKVAVYMREQDGALPEAILGIEFFYTREAGVWRLVESGGCTGESCRIRGAALLPPRPST